MNYKKEQHLLFDKVILDKAVQLLAQRNHSEFELSQKLWIFFSKKLSRQTKSAFNQFEYDYCSHQNDDFSLSLKNKIAEVVGYCQQKNWLNEENFVADYIAMRQRKGFGYKRIELELRQKGVKPEIIHSQLVNLSSQKQSLEQLTNLIQHRYGMINLSDMKQRQKIHRFLLNRGFSHQIIQRFYDISFEDDQ
jgi:regulatory protein